MRISVPGDDLGRYPRAGTRRYAPRDSKTYLRSKLTRFMPPGAEPAPNSDAVRSAPRPGPRVRVSPMSRSMRAPAGRVRTVAVRLDE
jgi:hypothetical protein